ncbi:M1 family metallopeptidase [Actinomadura rudentiformis]|nr:M1 family metallopeptidase [Actinomadura rudentiformis]
MAMRPSRQPRRPRGTGRALPLALAAVSVVALAPAASADRADYRPGAPGLGDPYFPELGNGGYDVRHYGVDAAYDPATDTLRATAVISARATHDLSRFNLDFYKMNVRSVHVNGKAAEFTRTGERELVITPRKGLRKSSTFRVTVRYDGVPETLSGPIVFGLPYGFVHTPDGASVSSEPNGASTWFPANDHPRDKALFTLKMSVPKDLKAIGNGHLVKQWTKGDRASFVWHEDSPMAPYLATVAIGRFNVSTTTTGKGLPQLDAVDPDVAAHPDAVATPRHTTRATDELADYFGRYPFTTTGSITENNLVPPINIGYALETQSRPIYHRPRAESTVVHEIGHQWFGNSVSTHRWKDIWLNEGWARFVEWYWTERHGGQSAQVSFQQTYDNPPAPPPGRPAFWDVVVADPTRDQMFHGAVYSRGGMTLQALRQKIGDEKFFRLARTWVKQKKYGTATTEEFTSLAEKIAGQDLDQFFRVWLYQPGKPTSW